MKHKILAAAMAVLMLLALCSCGKKDPVPPESTSVNTPAEPVEGLPGTPGGMEEEPWENPSETTKPGETGDPGGQAAEDPGDPVADPGDGPVIDDPPEELTGKALSEELLADYDPTVKYEVSITVQDYGTIVADLDYEAAPASVENFVALADAGFYDGLTFHRIIDGFMVQGGDPAGNGTGGSDKEVYGEFSENGWENGLSHVRGVLSMARSDDPDSASSQFFIVHEDSTYLDGKYAAFGHVVDGMDVVDAICADAKPVDDNGTIPAAKQPVITSVTVRKVPDQPVA